MTTFSHFSEVLEKYFHALLENSISKRDSRKAFGCYVTLRPLEIVTSWSLTLLYTDEEIFRSLFDGN